MAHTRINLLNVPVDIVAPSELENEMMSLIHSEGEKQICFISIWQLLKARRNKEYLACLKNASLILPVSKSILKGAQFLKKGIPYRYNPFTTIIQILGILEKNYKSLYLLGGRKDTLMTAERNLRSTFPGVQIVGRYVGYYPKNVETNIVSAVYKSSPTLFLTGDGLSGADCWYYRRRKQFSPSTIALFSKDILRIFAKQKQRISEDVFNRGNEIWVEVFKNPLKIFLLLPFLRYNFLLLWYRLFKKDS